MNTNNSATMIDNGGEFPVSKSRTRGSWSDVYDAVDALSVGVSHVRVLVPDRVAAKKLVTSCHVRYSRIDNCHIETRTAPSAEGVYVYIRKIEK